jgi:leucyl aminopeptidase
MTLTLSQTPAAEIAADLLVIPVAGPPLDAAALRRLPTRLRDALLAEARRRQFTGSRGQECWAHGVTPSVPLALLVGGGSLAATPVWYEIADLVVRQAARLHARRVTVIAGDAGPDALRALAEGVPLARYRFTRYRSRDGKPEPLAIIAAVHGIDAARREAVRLGALAAAATALTRDLANTPAQDLAPMDLARVARGLARRGLRVRVHDRRALAKLRMGAILGVGMGSAQPPCFVEITYRPPRPRRHVALVGKGITFDSGGLSLKNADAMMAQKRDMAGAAVVLGVMSALPALELPVEVRGYIASAENMPSGNAMRPGDVLRAYNGTTIEVLNTDAEGRLVLADALSYAARQRPDCIIDFATLTAVVRTALGPRCAAVLGSDRRLIGELIASAAEANEMLWELPLIEEYRRDIDSRVADLKNVGEGHSGTIVAALFLREFVAGLPWAHVDFSSTVMSDGFACHPKGASGYGVRTMLRWLARFAVQPASGAAVAAARRGTISRPARRG